MSSIEGSGHNYFFAVPKTWKENTMSPLDGATAERLDGIEERLDEIERILEILLDWQECAEEEGEHAPAPVDIR